jgi:hypothetical protein
MPLTRQQIAQFVRLVSTLVHLALRSAQCVMLVFTSPAKASQAVSAARAGNMLMSRVRAARPIVRSVQAASTRIRKIKGFAKGAAQAASAIRVTMQHQRAISAKQGHTVALSRLHARYAEGAQ